MDFPEEGSSDLSAPGMLCVTYTCMLCPCLGFGHLQHVQYMHSIVFVQAK